MSNHVKRSGDLPGSAKHVAGQESAGAVKQIARRGTSGRPLRREFGWSWALLGLAIIVLGGLVLLNTFSGSAGQQTSTNPLIGRVTETTFSGPQASGLLAVGSPIPDLRYNLAGADSSISTLKGQPLLLEFFATWCPHCQAETPILSRIEDRYKDRGLKVLAVSASPLSQDQRGQISAADVESYMQKYAARYPHLIDMSLVGARRFGIRSFPALYLVDSCGVILMAREGEVPEQELVAAIEQALAA